CSHSFDEMSHLFVQIAHDPPVDLGPMEAVGESPRSARVDPQAVVAHVEIDNALRSNHFRTGPDAGGNVVWQRPATVQLSGYLLRQFAGRENCVLGFNPEMLHQLCDGARINTGDVGSRDPLKNIDIMHSEIKTGVRRAVQPNSYVANGETPTRRMDRLTDLA